mgnify:CR=1 FL=1
MKKLRKVFILLQFSRSMINLSEEYIKNCNPFIFDRIKFHFYSDFYYANSLREIQDHFSENPPNKKFFNSELSALVLVKNLEVKRMNPDNFEEEDGASLAGLDKGFSFPIFEIKDITDNRLAYWMAGNSKEYLMNQETFGFNRNYYVKIPKTFLKYNHNPERGTLSIEGFKFNRKK